MELTIPDYGILAMTAAGAVIGLFIGVSGALAFLAGAVAASVAGCFAWPLSADFISHVWLRGIAVGVVSLLAFGIVRWLVKKVVHGLVAQPGDALLGSLLAALTGAVVSLGVVWGIGLVFPGNPDVASVLLERLFVLFEG